MALWSLLQQSLHVDWGWEMGVGVQPVWWFLTCYIGSHCSWGCMWTPNLFTCLASSKSCIVCHRISQIWSDPVSCVLVGTMIYRCYNDLQMLQWFTDVTMIYRCYNDLQMLLVEGITRHSPMNKRSPCFCTEGIPGTASCSFLHHVSIL